MSPSTTLNTTPLDVLRHQSGYNGLFFRQNSLVNVNEQKQKEALKEFYEKQRKENTKQKVEKRILRLRTFSRVINPLVCIGFVIVFWAAGMQHYYKEL